jgi:hypothetical protein
MAGLGRHRELSSPGSLILLYRVTQIVADVHQGADALPAPVFPRKPHPAAGRVEQRVMPKDSRKGAARPALVQRQPLALGHSAEALFGGC